MRYVELAVQHLNKRRGNSGVEGGGGKGPTSPLLLPPFDHRGSRSRQPYAAQAMDKMIELRTGSMTKPTCEISEGSEQTGAATGYSEWSSDSRMSAAMPIRTMTPEVAWRVKEMVRQRPDSGPINLLMARPGHFAIGTCISCGDPVTPRARGESYRCSACAQAIRLALDGLAQVTREA